MPAPNYNSFTMHNSLENRQRSSGFTLIELLVVLAIIGALASIAIPVYNNYVDKARVTIAFSLMDTIRKELESFHTDHQRYPLGINLTTGQEIPGGATVLSTTLMSQMDNDINNPTYTYNATNFSYTFTANAKDKVHTLITMTPAGTTY